MSDEEWRPIPGREGRYEASSKGRVRSVDRIDSSGKRRRGKVLSPSAHGVYLKVSKGHQDSERLVHFLVASAFHGPRPEGQEVRHLNGDPHDNRAVNLKWGTHAENVQDTIEHGNHTAANKTHCKHGHELSDWNLDASTLKRGFRRCASCRQATQRLWANPGEQRSFNELADLYYRNRELKRLGG